MTIPELDANQLEAMQTLLEELQHELEKQLHLGSSATQPVELDQQSVGRVSRIDAIQQQQMAIASHDQAAVMLKQVRQALNRIESREYGLCSECGEPIALARLQVQPFARRCIDCQSAAEAD